MAIRLDESLSAGVQDDLAKADSQVDSILHRLERQP